MANIERRSIEIRAGNDFKIVARACKYGAISENLGSFVETIAAGCFADSLKRGAEVVCLVNHSQSEILGRTRNGSLQIEDKADGLYFSCALNKNVQAHRDLYELVKDSTISECSFAFLCEDQSWDESQTPVLRTVKKATLCDVSVVVTPAYQNGATMAEARRKETAPKAAAASEARMRQLARDLSAPYKKAAPNLGSQNRFRQLAQAFIRDYKFAFEKVWATIHPATRDAGAGDEVMNFASHMQRAHECAELAHAYFCQANDVLDSSDDDEADDDTRRFFAGAMMAAENCCRSAADARNAHGQHLKSKQPRKCLFNH